MDYFASIICAREDNQWAMSLYHELEDFVVPSYLRKQNPSLRKNLRPIFYYHSDIPAGPSLKWLDAQRLKNSNYLIVVCSHNTCGNAWLMRDVDFFISTGRDYNIILYIVEESFNDWFPDDWKLFNLGGSVEAYHVDQKESIKRVVEIMLGLSKGSINNSNDKPSSLLRFIQKLGIAKNAFSSSESSNNTSDSFNEHHFERSENNNSNENAPIHDSSGGERQYQVNTSTLTIRFGNILDSDAEVIVSSDDNELSMGGGVSGAILVNGGEVILDDARKNIPAQLGDVVITTAGKLPQKYIFHCVTIDYADGQRNASEDKGLQEYIIRRSVDKCLRMMPLLGVESIAFPAIGAGVAHFSLEEVAISMADLITDFLYTTSKQYQIEIYLYDRFHQRGVLDYLVFFENVARSIDNHKKTNMINSGMVEPSPVMMPETLKTRPFGKMAASSPNDEHKVFVSYSRDNIEIVRLFCEQMDDLEITYWIDVNGKYSGNNFKEVLVDAIDSSQVMLFLSSQESNQSPFVIKEISIAVSDNKTILPIKLDDAPYAKSIRFDLSDIDWIEFSKDKCDEAMEKFRCCLQLYLQ